MQNIRLDVYLHQNSLAKSREYAKILIKNKQVLVNKKIVTKAAQTILETDIVEAIKQEISYVSRGGFKLEKALKSFDINAENNICMDIGASTGGFTDCLLQNNAKLVYAVDVGTSQLDLSLINNEKIINLEKTNIKTITKKDFLKIDLIVCDVSFISLTQIIPIISSLLEENGKAIMLIKPQFEIGISHKLKKGVVKDIESHKKILYNILNNAKEHQMSAQYLDYSPIKGAKGNIEYLFYCIKNGCGKKIDIENTVKKAKADLKEV